MADDRFCGSVSPRIRLQIANQITEAYGWEQAPRYLIRDRDGADGEVFIRRLRSMGHSRSTDSAALLCVPKTLSELMR